MADNHKKKSRHGKNIQEGNDQKKKNLTKQHGKHGQFKDTKIKTAN